jgi:hypothetical protein
MVLLLLCYCDTKTTNTLIEVILNFWNLIIFSEKLVFCLLIYFSFSTLKGLIVNGLLRVHCDIYKISYSISHFNLFPPLLSCITPAPIPGTVLNSGADTC